MPVSFTIRPQDAVIVANLRSKEPGRPAYRLAAEIDQPLPATTIRYGASAM